MKKFGGEAKILLRHVFHGLYHQSLMQKSRWSTCAESPTLLSNVLMLHCGYSADMASLNQMPLALPLEP